MNGFTIKNILYLIFTATIFYFVIGKIFKVIKFRKLNYLNKGIYFSIFILLFYFFYKVILPILFGNNKIVEGISLMDTATSSGSSEDSSGSIDYTKGWGDADGFRSNYCSKNPIYLSQDYFDSKDKTTGNPQGGLVYGGISVLYDSTTKDMNKQFIDAIMTQAKNGNKVDPSSFTQDNGCVTNLKADIGGTGSMTQLCNPNCNFKFTGSNSSSSSS